MNNNSFYGGRDGRPMIITKKYSTVQEMLKDFSGLEEIKPFEEESNPGTGSRPYATELGVAFGDYVIIETENRNNPENGRIFRRGLDFNNIKNDDAISGWILNEDTNIYEEKDFPSYGAKLVSQIVGPAGDAPHFQPVPFVDEEGITQTLDSIKQKYEAYDVMSGEGVFDITTGNLVPGKNEEGTFTDDITWKHTSVRDRNAESSTAYIDFTFPYDVIEFDADTKDPYFHRSDIQYDADGNEIEGTKINIFENLDLVERHAEDDQTHPFYQKWQIHIPKGIHGKSVEAVYVTTAHNDVVEFELNDKNELQYGADGKLIVKDYEVEGEENAKADDIANSRKILVCDIVDYDRVPEGDKYVIYLGDYNMIDDISLDDEGTFTIQYAHDNDDERKKLLTWITEVNLSDTGKLNIKTNNHNEGTEIIDKQLQWVKDITFDENGTVILHYINGTTSEDTYENLIDWIKSISIAQDGAVTVISNNGTDLLDSNQVALQWIDKIALAENGKFTYGYNTEDSNEAHDSTQIKWPTNISVNSEGSVTTQYNDENIFPSQTSEKQLNWVASATTGVEEVEGKNEMMFRMSFNNDNLSPLATKLTTPNEIKIDTGVVSVKYNSAPDTWVEIGRVDTVSSSAASEEEGADPNLGVGGIWFVTQEM